MMTPEPIISCDHLSVRLHGRRVIDDLTWSLAEGDCAVILGPSGSGKTVFLHTLLGFHQPAAGSVQLKGLDHADRFQAAAVIFQEDALLDGRTVEANLALAREERADLLGGPFLPETEAAIDEALREVRLDPARVRRRLPGALSGGERRRVALARALIRRPRVLMADEPTTGLDPGSAGVIYDLLAEQIARRRMSAVIISHDPACASRLGRPVYYFSPTDGRLPCWTEPSAMQSAEARRRNLILWMEERLEEHLTRTAEPADPAPVGPSSPSLTELMPGRRAVETFLDGLGRAGLFLGHLAQPPATALLARALRAWGVGSIPLVGLIFFMLGIVMEVQAEAAVVDYGLSNRLPELVARSLLRLAPILTGLLAAGRCGSGICAETGWMQLGGSLRALRTLRIQPERTLFPPLFWALTLAVPLLALGGLMVGAMGALLTLASPFSQARISPEFFLSSYPTFLTPLEGVTVALKGALMGAGIAVIAFTGGAQPKRSTADLTRAMTGGLVTAFLWVTLVDTLMSLFLPT